MNALAEFFSPQAGQRRRNWLDQQSQGVANALSYYLGPTGLDNKVNALAQLAQFTDAGDYAEAADASRALWDQPNFENSARYATAAAAMMIPALSARMVNGSADVLGDAIASGADDARRFVGDESGAIDLESLRRKYPGAKIDISGSPERGYVVNRIVLPDGARGRGTGSQIMGDILTGADESGATVSLTPSGDFGGNVGRLTEFYKRFGFIPNSGRNKDFAISEAMYRPASEIQNYLDGVK